MDANIRLAAAGSFTLSLHCQSIDPVKRLAPFFSSLPEEILEKVVEEVRVILIGVVPGAGNNLILDFRIRGCPPRRMVR